MDLETHLLMDLETHLADGSRDNFYEVFLLDDGEKVANILR
jgi:hypothetical protein